MSRIYFLYSKKPLPQFNALEEIDKTRFLFQQYPFLKGKENLYEVFYPFEMEQETLVFLRFIENCINDIERMSLVVLEETSLKEEIEYFNTKMQNTIRIRVMDKGEVYYAFKYALEHNALKQRTEYILEI